MLSLSNTLRIADENTLIHVQSHFQQSELSSDDYLQEKDTEVRKNVEVFVILCFSYQSKANSHHRQHP